MRERTCRFLLAALTIASASIFATPTRAQPVQPGLQGIQPRAIPYLDDSELLRRLGHAPVFAPSARLGNHVQQVVPKDDWFPRTENRESPRPRPPSAGGVASPRTPCDRSISAFLKWDGNSLRTYKSLYDQNGEYRAAADELDRSCFEELKTIDPLLARNLGTLALDGVAFCMAWRVAPGLLLTARHCFYQKARSKMLSVEGERRADVRFQPLDPTLAPLGIKKLHSIDPGQDDYSDEIPHASDRLLIELVADIADGGATIPMAIPAKNAPLSIIGIYSYSFNARATSALRRTSGETCYIGVIDGTRCIYHGCNTTPGFSGSPLLVNDSGAVKIVGLHVAGARETGRCAWSSNSDGVGNVGATLPQNLNLARSQQ